MLNTRLLAVCLVALALTGCMPDYAKQEAENEARLRKEGIIALTLGQEAPRFSAVATDGTSVDPLADGGNAVLLFFPAADTPNSTAELLALSRSQEALRAAGVSAYGVGPATPAELAAYAARYKISIPLLSDADRSVARLYGCATAASLYPQRALVCINAERRIALYMRMHTWTANPANTILGALGLQAPAK